MPKIVWRTYNVESKALQSNLFQDKLMSPENQIKTHKEFADCRYEGSVNEIKIILGLMSLIRKYNNEFRTFNFSFDGLAKYLGISHKNRKSIVREIIEGIDGKKVYLPDGFYDDLPLNERPSVPWLVRNQISESRDFVELKLNPELADLIIGPEVDTNYLTYKLAIIWKMRSTYSIKIYHLLLKHFWVRDGQVIKNSFEMTIAELKKLLQIPDNVYPLPGNFKAKVINTAKQECDKYADITFNVEPKKTGKTITAYKFNIFKNAKYKPEIIELDPIASRLTGLEKYDRVINDAIKNGYDEAVKLLIKNNISKSGVAEIIQICSPTQIINVIKEIEAKKLKHEYIAGTIVNRCREISQGNFDSEYERLRLEINNSINEAAATSSNEDELNSQLDKEEIAQKIEALKHYSDEEIDQLVEQILNDPKVNSFTKERLQQTGDKRNSKLLELYICGMLRERD